MRRERKPRRRHQRCLPRPVAPDPRRASPDPRRDHDPPRDAGSAVVEFLGVALLLMVPVVYLVLVLGELQAASFAVEGAARQAARSVVTADDEVTGAQRAVASVGVALTDQGFTDPPDQALTVTCPDGCLAPGGTATARVAIDVVLPGVPSWLHDAVPLAIGVEATATAERDTYVATP